MTRVVCFGEALIDFLNTGRKQVERLETNDFRQFPGGAPANVAVAVAKLGGDAWFAGQVGNDQFGEFLLHSLRTYDVHTDFTPAPKWELEFVSSYDGKLTGVTQQLVNLRRPVSLLQQHADNARDCPGD